MQKLNNDDYKKILSKLLIKSLSNPEPAREIVEQAMSDKAFEEQVCLLCNSYMEPRYIHSKLIAKSIEIRALQSLVSICKREQIGILPIDFSDDEDRVFNKNDKISILVLSGQISEFNKAAIEALAVSGTAGEINRHDADKFARKIKDENPMIEIKNVKKKTYEYMKENIKKLPYEMRFTMFPKQNEHGNIDVGFFSKTEEVSIRRRGRVERYGPYFIPKIASIVLASSLLEKPELNDKYEKIKKEKNKEIQDVLDLYYNLDDIYYLVPASVSKDGLNVFCDQAFEVNYYNDKITTLDIEDFIKAKTNGLNNIVVPMTLNEYETYKNEIIINAKEIQFFHEHTPPEYIDRNEFVGKELTENLIDILNRKREQILLMSDDFDGNNLINLDDYIVVTIHELIMREDEAFTNWIKKDEIMDAKEMSLLSDLEQSYSMSSVYEQHDIVTELINKERQELESYRSIADTEDISL